MKLLGQASNPVPGTDAANQKRNELIANLYILTGDLRFLLLPKITDTTASTDPSKNGVADGIAYDSSIAGKLTTVGSGVAITFNGTSTEADIADNDNFSFGDGFQDDAFSIFALVNMTDATNSTILSKWDVTATLREWRFHFDANDDLTLELYDESANTYIGRKDDTAFTQGAWKLVVATYDGTATNNGIRIYIDRSRLDDVDVSSGVYVAMENTAQEVEIGEITDSDKLMFDGKLAMVGLTGKALTHSEVASMTYLVNSFFGLSL